MLPTKHHHFSSLYFLLHLCFSFLLFVIIPKKYFNPKSEHLKLRLLVFSTNKNICLYSLPLDGNPFRSLGVIGHSKGLRKFRVDSKNRRVFTIGNKCNSIMMWRINSR